MYESYTWDRVATMFRHKMTSIQEMVNDIVGTVNEAILPIQHNPYRA
jgi:hypothetical protein